MIDQPKYDDRSKGHFNWASLAVLLFALALLAASAGQTAYRVLLPTEGWTYDSGTDFNVNTIIFRSNLLGEPTPIRPHDELRAVEGIGIDQVNFNFSGPAISDAWRVGQVVQYTVVRDGKTITLDVPLKRWTAAGVAAYAIGDAKLVGGWLADLLMFGIGLFVLLKRPEASSARALFLLAAVLLTTSISSRIVPDGPTTQYSAVFALTAVFSYWIWGILLAPTLFVLSLTFPRPKRILQRVPWLVVLPYAAFWVLVAIFGWLPQVGFGLSGVFFVLSLLSVIHSAFTQRDAVSRAQLLWGLGGFLSAIVLFLPMFLNVFLAIGGVPSSTIPSWQTNLADALTNFAFPVFTGCLAIAILRYRLFDIHVIINRTLVYGALTAILAAVYIASVVGLQRVFQVFTGETQSELVTVVSTLAIAALFQPLRRRIQAIIDQRFYRRKYDAAKTLAAFNVRMRDETDIDRLTGDVVHVVEQTLQPAHVSLWLRRRDVKRKT